MRSDASKQMSTSRFLCRSTADGTPMDASEGRRAIRHSRHRRWRNRFAFRPGLANALSKMKHVIARLLLGLGGQELLSTLVLTIAASVEAVRPDGVAPGKMKPAKLQGFYPNFKCCR